MFQQGNTYENVYLIVLDAAGYSTLVRFNPRDQAARVFDLLRERILTRLRTAATEHRCARAELWSWHGDGGILTIHDDDESAARDVALSTARDILALDLAHVRTELPRLGMTGELHLRLVVHKGPIRFSGNGHTGSLHSPELNFAAHLEHVTPPDCIAISDPVHATAGPHRPAFTLVGNFESRLVYLATPAGNPAAAHRAWLTSTGLTDSHPVFSLPQRPSQSEKARLIAAAHTDILDLGTALHTSAHYLTTTERPALVRDAVLDFLSRGGTYRCVLLDPTCQTTTILSAYRNEDLPTKIRTSISEFASFKARHSPATDRLHIYQSQVFPGFAAIAVDLDSPDPIILFSPYLMAPETLDINIDHGDSPHYLATSTSGPLTASLASLLQLMVLAGVLKRVG